MRLTVHVLSTCLTEELNNSMKNKITILLLLFAGTRYATAQDTTVYNLQQCIDMALKQNAAVAQADFQTGSRATQLLQARAAFFPSLNGYANQGINQGKSINPYTNTFINQQTVTGQYGLNAGLVLFNGLNMVNTMRSQALNYEADKFDREQVILETRIAVTLAFLQVLSLEEQLKQAQQQQEISRLQLERLAVLEKNNAVSPSLLYDTRGQLANEKINFINTSAALETTKNVLADLMNTTFSATVKFEKTDAGTSLIVAQPLTTGVDDAVKNMPALKSAAYRTNAAGRAVWAARGAFLPVVSLNGSIGTNYSDAALSQTLTGFSYASTDDYVVVNNTPVSVFSPQYNYNSTKISFNEQFRNNLGSYAGISIQVPLFNGLAKKGSLNQAKLSHVLAQNQQQTAETKARIAINEAWQNRYNAWQRYEVYQQQVSDYNASYKIAETRFEKGVLTTLEYLTAKINADRATQNFIVAKYDYVLRTKIMEYYAGK